VVRAEDRRKSPRLPVEGAVRLTSGGTSTTGRLRDLCRDAALVEVEAVQALGAFVTLAVELPDGPIEVSGQVIRLAQGDEGRHGAAVLFSDVPAESAHRIESLLAGQAARKE